MRKQQIKEYLDTEIALAQKDLAELPQGPIGSSRREALLSRMKYVAMEAEKQTKAAQTTFGNNFWLNEPSIAPIRGALAVWNLTIDDLDFASLHGTSTVMNDKNETNVIQQQMSHLGRKSGNPLFAITQKYLTGHSKGAAGAWMLNGALQAMDTGIIPGNRNADNIDTALAKNDFFVFPNRSIETLGLKAFSLTSFGFGQKGAQAIGVHPRYLYSTISQQEYETYKLKTLERQRAASSHFQRALATNSIFVAKDHAPYTEAQQSAVLLNPTVGDVRGVKHFLF
jgi:fatty acid synthase subunit alpha